MSQTTSMPGASTSSTPDTLVVDVSEDYYLGDAQFTVAVDGVQQGGVMTATTLDSSGNSQAFSFSGNYGAGQHVVTLSFLNDAYGGSPSLDRNLYVNDIIYDGNDTGDTAALYWAAPISFTVSAGAGAPVAPTVTWSPAAASGAEGSAIALGTISNGLTGDANSLQSLTVSGIPVGATLSDGTNSFTAVAGSTAVNVAGWGLSTLTFVAASATTANLAVTATVQNAQGNTSTASASEVVTVGASSGYPDGSANAPAGTPELPNLFATEAVRPPWEVAGVDYYVGVPGGTALKAPTAANLPAGATLSGQTIYVTGSNVTISGFDLSGNGGYGIVVDPGASGTNITDNYFADSVSTAPIAVQIEPGASNTTIADNTINGGGASGNASVGETIFNMGSGLTVEHNFIENVPQHFVTTEAGNLNLEFNLMENGAQTADAHLNFLQYGGGASSNAIVEFNTLVQSPALGGAGEGFQEYNNDPGSITNADVSFNTMISQAVAPQSGASGPAVSYWLHLGTPSGSASPATGVANNNYFDTSSAYGAIYPDLTGFTYSGNIDLKTGAAILAR